MGSPAFDMARHPDGVRIDLGAELVPLVVEALYLYELDSGNRELHHLATRLREATGGRQPGS